MQCHWNEFLLFCHFHLIPIVSEQMCHISLMVMQCAGVVCDRGLTLKDLIGTLKMFFDRLGLKKLRFKPAYNPYTEPSMEIFRYPSFLPAPV